MFQAQASVDLSGVYKQAAAPRTVWQRRLLSDECRKGRSYRKVSGGRPERRRGSNEKRLLRSKESECGCVKCEICTPPFALRARPHFAFPSASAYNQSLISLASGIIRK